MVIFLWFKNYIFFSYFGFLLDSRFGYLWIVVWIVCGLSVIVVVVLIFCCIEEVIVWLLKSLKVVWLSLDWCFFGGWFFGLCCIYNNGDGLMMLIDWNFGRLFWECIVYMIECKLSVVYFVKIDRWFVICYIVL